MKVQSCLHVICLFEFLEPPTFTDDQDSHKFLGPALGVAVQLECPVTGNPIPEIIWRKDGVLVQEDSSHVIQQSGSVFLIRAIKEYDVGNYECEAGNGIGETLRRTFAVGK
jgi:Immunoglobulin I-set domain